MGQNRGHILNSLQLCDANGTTDKLHYSCHYFDNIDFAKAAIDWIYTSMNKKKKKGETKCFHCYPNFLRCPEFPTEKKVVCKRAIMLLCLIQSHDVGLISHDI